MKATQFLVKSKICHFFTKKDTMKNNGAGDSTISILKNFTLNKCSVSHQTQIESSPLDSSLVKKPSKISKFPQSPSFYILLALLAESFIIYASVLVKLTDMSPINLGFYRIALALPIFWLMANTRRNVFIKRYCFYDVGRDIFCL